MNKGKKLEVALQTLYNIRHLAISDGDAAELLGRILVNAVDACNEIEERQTSIDDRPLVEWKSMQSFLDGNPNHKFSPDTGALIS